MDIGVMHVDYPHTPGRLHDCPACEARCHCTLYSTACVYDGEHRFDKCRTCGDPADDGEGWDGECGNCADRTYRREVGDDWMTDQSEVDALLDGAMCMSTEPHRPDVKAATPVETQHVTAECRTNRGAYVAWDDAVHLLRHVYETQIHHDPDATISIAIYRTAVVGSVPQPREGER